MNDEIDDAISKQNFYLVKSLILKASERSRTVVGLTKDSELSPLHIAAFYDPEAALKMLKLGFEPDLHVAVALGLIDTIEAIASKSPEQFDKELEYVPPLGTAILKGQTEAVKSLLRFGDNPNRPFQRIGWFVWEIEAINKGIAEWFPIHMAAIHGYKESMINILKTLILAGADLSLTSSLGMCAIHLSATPNWIHLVGKLLDLGADIDAKTTPLQNEIHKLSGTPIRNTPFAYNHTPLMVAIKEGHVESTAMLIQHKANIQAIDSNGWTALHHAACPWWEENPEIAKLLIDAGADQTTKDMTGRTPADLAKESGNEDTIKLFNS